jgi:hypothetical protein
MKAKTIVYSQPSANSTFFKASASVTSIMSDKKIERFGSFANHNPKPKKKGQNSDLQADNSYFQHKDIGKGGKKNFVTQHAHKHLQQI